LIEEEEDKLISKEAGALYDRLTEKAFLDKFLSMV
jgi:hypothetical protein